MEKLPKALAFDLDGTLAPSKAHLEGDMASVLTGLLNYIPLAVVSGASKDQFRIQFLNYLNTNSVNFSNLYIFPENGASLEVYKNNEWVTQYEDKFDNLESDKIINALDIIINKYSLSKDLGYGNLIENRGSQITMSALGQNAPLELKEKWDPEQKIRRKMKNDLDEMIPGFEIRIGGSTSIDITKKGENKAVAIKNFIKILNLSKEDVIYFGDALFPGGNDEIVKETGVSCRQVSNPQDTIKVIRDILYKYEETNRQ